MCTLGGVATAASRSSEIYLDNFFLDAGTRADSVGGERARDGDGALLLQRRQALRLGVLQGPAQVLRRGEPQV